MKLPLVVLEIPDPVIGIPVEMRPGKPEPVSVTITQVVAPATAPPGFQGESVASTPPPAPLKLHPVGVVPRPRGHVTGSAFADPINPIHTAIPAATASFFMTSSIEPRD